MTPYTFTVDGLAPEAFDVVSFRGKEAMSTAWSFRIVARAAADIEDLERAALGRAATLAWTVGESARAFYGVVASIRLGASVDDGRIDCHIHFAPRLWLLRRKRKTRIFQRMRVPDIVTKVLLDAGIAARWQLAKVYPVRDYCTQYEETDYAFVCRLLAEAGIFFYFPAGGPASGTLADVAAAMGLVGSIGGDVVANFAGSAAGAAFGAAASTSSPILPGDTLICGDDAAFYPPIGTDDPAALIATSVVAAAPEIAAAIGDAASGLPTIDGLGVAEVAALAGTLVGELGARAAPPLEFFQRVGTSIPLADKITRFDLRTSVRATAAEFRDYDPDRPLTRLQSRALSVAPFPESALKTLASVATSVGSGVANNVGGTVGDVASGVATYAGAVGTALETIAGEYPPPYLEVYDHHGSFLFPKWTIPDDEAPRMMRQSRRRASVATGASGCPDLEPGHKFSLVGHPAARFDRAYVLTAVEHVGRARPSPDAEARYAVYENVFECAPASMSYVPKRPKRKSVQVSLTAVVVGPSGAEIHVNEMGQIKVQFHWDREGKNDDNSSCWIRTMHPWGGAGWGVQFIPRVGMEVVVVFEGGDPDKPMVIGALYNATHPSPFLLPKDKTRSGWRTQSSPGGGGFNELSFEDLKGREQVFLHAQRDLDEIIEHNHSLSVKNDELIRIIGNRLDQIDKNLEEIVKGDRRSRVEGNRVDVVVGNADERVTGARLARVEARDRLEVQGPADNVYADDLTLRVLGCLTTIVGKNDKKRSWTTHAQGTATLAGLDKLELVSDAEVVLKVGDSSIRISKERIEIAAKAIQTAGGGGELLVDDKGLKMGTSDAQLHMDDKVVVKSPKASMKIGEEVQVDGPKILLNSPDQAKAEPPKDPEPPTHIALLDQDGSPVPFQRFVALLDDGSEVGGRTDKDGKATLELKTGGNLLFPDIPLDGEEAKGPFLPHVIRQGDHLDRLAFVHGFDAEKVWADPKNQELKDKRKKPSILHPGDVVYFPRARREGMPLSKGTSNSYTAKIPKKTIRVAFTSDARLKNAKYAIEGCGAPIEGSTDADGNLVASVPVYARQVRVVFVDAHVQYVLNLGDLDPIEETTGVRTRLQHLGYRKEPGGRGESEEEALEEDRAAIAAFQRDYGIEPTGEAEAATREKLRQVHGS